MKALGLVAFTIYFVFLGWLWVRDWRAGEINRFPHGVVYLAEQPGRFKVWTVVHGAIGCVLLGLLLLAWWALFTGNLK